MLRQLLNSAVFRVTAIYAAASWTVIEAADILLPEIGAPPGLLRSIVVALLVGLPFAIVLTWLVTTQSLVSYPAKRRTRAIAFLGVLMPVAVVGTGWVAFPQSNRVDKEPPLTRNQAIRTLSVPNAPHLTISFNRTPLAEVLQFFTEFTGRQIAYGRTLDVADPVNASWQDWPWDAAFRALLTQQRLIAYELPGGAIFVVHAEFVNLDDLAAPLTTALYSFSSDTFGTIIESMLSERGRMTRTHATDRRDARQPFRIVVTDIPRVHTAIKNLSGGF